MHTNLTEPPRAHQAQLDFSGPVLGKRSTSRQAAESVRRSAPRQRHRILTYLADRGRQGATRDEISVDLGIDIQAVTPRIVELLRSGAAIESTDRRTTRKGRMAAVLVAVRPAGAHDG